MLYQALLPKQGELVEVRRRRYVVVEVAQDSLPSLTPDAPDSALRPQNLVTLSSVEDDALGEELQVIWEVEPGARVIEETYLPQPLGFDTPQRLDTFLNAVRWGAASSADVKALQAPFRSGIDLEDYQLEPVAKAIEMPRANLLIADDVGLGKTIEAGLVAQELLIRHRARRILIVCPASLQVQWREQMLSKFGLEFRIIDSQSIHQLRVERGLHANPWTHFPRLITSVDFLKRERPMRLFNEVVEGKPVFPRLFDLLILDEAHNVAPSGRGRYATDSLRTQAIRRLVPHFEHRLFLSATPHNGYPESFAALLELLDNQRFTRRVQPTSAQLDAMMVRRLKSELPALWDGSPRFPRRFITPLEVAYTPAECAIHQQLQLYCTERVREARERHDQTEVFATEFVAMLLKKRLFSSPAAFFSTLTKHEQALGETRRPGAASRRTDPGILRGRIEKVEEENDNDEELNEATSAALEAAAPLFHAPGAHERKLLDQMLAYASAAQHTPDSKANALLSWLHATIKPVHRWTRERVIVFTEYRDTQNWLYGLLARAGLAEKGPHGEPRLLMLYGGMTTDEREAIKAAFQAHPDEADVRILLATDAASEGIDLQNYCSRLIHFEIPWNPNRLEQRNGRVDRHGQHAKQVDIYHFVSETYRKQAGFERSQLDTDLEFLHSAVEKIDQIREDLGSVGPVIAQQVEEAMLGRRSTLDTRKAESEAATKGMRRYRKGREHIESRIRQLTEELHASREALKLTPANVQAVVQTALEFAGQPPLLPRTLSDPHGKHPAIEVFDVPELSGSWAKGSAGLEHPHSHVRRPIVFDQAKAYGRDDVVLAHLNHPLVAMSLRLLRAEIWSSGTQGHLYRVTARVVASHLLDAPAVIAHARLLILGGDNQRLHEELIVAGGYLRDEGRFERLNEGQLKKVQDATSAADPLVPETLRLRLAARWEHVRPALVGALEARRKTRTESQHKKLAERSTQEQQAISAVLSELKQQIETEIAQFESVSGPVQLSLTGFSNDERQQLKEDIAVLRTRAAQIDAEIAQEVQRIRQRFADPQSRLFPVAVTYVVPEKFVLV